MCDNAISTPLTFDTKSTKIRPDYVSDNAISTPINLNTKPIITGRHSHYLGMLVYASVSNWRQEDRIDLRFHECTDQMTMFPTKRGISLHLQEWIHLKYCVTDIESDIDRCKQNSNYIGAVSIGRSNFIKIYRAENNRVYVDIRYYAGCDEVRYPTQRGVRLSLTQWKKLMDIDFDDELPQLKYLRPCFYDPSHANQEFKCGYCVSNTQAVISARVFDIRP